MTAYGYSDADEVATVDPPGAGANSYTYWPGGQPKRFTNEDGGYRDYAYDPAQRLVAETDPNGAVTGYGYSKDQSLGVSDELVGISV